MTINTEDITTGTAEGTGIFDVLMQAARVHLQAEFDANRIRGNDYATVYTATIGQAMQVAASYATTKPLTDQQVLNAQAEALNIPKQGNLVDAQIADVYASTAMKDQQTSNLVAESLNIPKQGRLLDAQKDNLVSENKVIELQDDNLQAQINHVEKQTLHTEATTLQTIAQTSMINAELLNVAKQGNVLDAQVNNLVSENKVIELQDDKLQADISLTSKEELRIVASTLNIPKEGAVLDAQVANLVSENKVIELQDNKLEADILLLAKQEDMITAQIAQVAAETLNIPKQGALLDKQIDIADNTIAKGTSEIALLNQKNITESAQTQSGVADANSVIGKQMALYTNQADGYIQDAKVKTAALWRDVASVQLNINENYTTAGTGFEDAGIKLVMDAARNGIGAVGNVTAPIMTLLGSSSTPQGTPYVDPGVTAIAEDGSVLTASVSGSVDHTTVGSYSLVYTATDSNNLTSNITRTVEVY